MLYTVSADALQGFRLMFDTPAHEGVERGGAAVPGGHGGPRRWANGDGGGAGGGGRQTVHAWLARYEREGMEGMGARSHRPTRCPLQMPALIDRLSDGRGSECVWPA